MRRFLAVTIGDAANVILSAVGHNLHRVLAGLKSLLRQLLIAIGKPFTIPTAFFSGSLAGD